MYMAWYGITFNCKYMSKKLSRILKGPKVLQRLSVLIHNPDFDQNQKDSIYLDIPL